MHQAASRRRRRETHSCMQESQLAVHGDEQTLGPFNSRGERKGCNERQEEIILQTMIRFAATTAFSKNTHTKKTNT